MFILLHPWLYQVWTLIITLALILVPDVPLYFPGKYILRKIKPDFHHPLIKIFKFIGILAIALFILEGFITLITIYQVNKYLGFRYASPGTPRSQITI